MEHPVFYWDILFLLLFSFIFVNNVLYLSFVISEIITIGAISGQLKNYERYCSMHYWVFHLKKKSSWYVKISGSRLWKNKVFWGIVECNFTKWWRIFLATSTTKVNVFTFKNNGKMTFFWTCVLVKYFQKKLITQKLLA